MSECHWQHAQTSLFRIGNDIGVFWNISNRKLNNCQLPYCISLVSSSLRECTASGRSDSLQSGRTARLALSIRSSLQFPQADSQLIRRFRYSATDNTAYIWNQNNTNWNDESSINSYFSRISLKWVFLSTIRTFLAVFAAARPSRDPSPGQITVWFREFWIFKGERLEKNQIKLACSTKSTNCSFSKRACIL